MAAVRVAAAWFGMLVAMGVDRTSWVGALQTDGAVRVVRCGAADGCSATPLCAPWLGARESLAVSGVVRGRCEWTGW